MVRNPFRNRAFSIGQWHVGLFCGERLLSRTSWKRYPWGYARRKKVTGFNIGPILVWKEDF